MATTTSVIIGSASFTDKSTIIRSRGEVSLVPNNVGADATLIGAFGMGIVSAEAFVAGTASIPLPFSDSDWVGWFMLRSFAYQYEFHSAVASLISSRSWEVDSKAMRKVGPNEVLVLMAESQVGAFNISMNIRTLIMLS